MKENYVYPVRTEAAEDGIVITFPDFPDLVTFAEKREDVIRTAQEALALKIMDLENRQEPVPEPGEAEPGAVFVHVWMPYFRNSIRAVYVKKSVTIPQWLDLLARERSVNFSAALVKGIKLELGIED